MPDHKHRRACQASLWAELLVATLLGVAATGATAQSPSPSPSPSIFRNVDVNYDNSTYVLKAVMFAPVPPATALAVLTDFPNMARFVPNVKSSRIVKGTDKDLTIEQSGTAKLAGLSFPYTSVREIVMTSPNTIRSTQIDGSMKSQVSTMTVLPEGAGTRMQYELHVVPSFITSTVMTPELLKSDIREEFTAFIDEMMRRSKD